MENPNEEYSLENLSVGKLLDRDTDFVNMGTYNYGNRSDHFLRDMVPYNGLNSKGNTGEGAGFFIPADDELFWKNVFRIGSNKEEIEKINLSQENILKFMEALE